MEFRIKQKELSERVSIVQKAVSGKSAMPILEGIFMSVREDILTLRATDLYISIETKTECEMIYEGEIVIGSKFFADIIRKLPDDWVNIKVEGNNMNVTCANSEFNLICQDPGDFPDFNEPTDMTDITIPSDIFKAAIRHTVFAVSQDESRKALMGVLLKIEPEKLSFVALDGYRIAIREIPGNFGKDEKFIIPGRALAELSKILPDEVVDITIQASKSHMVVDTENTKFFTRLIEGDYFNYADVFTNSFNTFVTVDKEEFLRSLERASLLAREERANLIKISIKGDQLTIKSNSEVGNVIEELRMEKEGDDINIAFNSRYIIEGLKYIDADCIKISLMGSLNPVIIRGIDDENYTYLVLPVRLAQDEF